MIIGICGGSGSGKSKICEALEGLGAFIIDADKVAREVTGGLLGELTAAFGVGILNPDGTLNRARLAKIVFNDSRKLSKLNQITHPKITGEIKNIVRQNSDKPYIIIDAAVLIESELWEICALTVAVCAPREIRTLRITARDNISRERALSRINAQPDDEYYINNCDLVIYNDNGNDILNSAKRILESFNHASFDY